MTDYERAISFAKWCINMAASHGGKEYHRVAFEARLRFPELKNYSVEAGPV